MTALAGTQQSSTLTQTVSGFQNFLQTNVPKIFLMIANTIYSSLMED